MGSYRVRRLFAVVLLLLLAAGPVSQIPSDFPTLNDVLASQNTSQNIDPTLEVLPVKGRAPKTGYARSAFGNGWADFDGCDTRNRILARDLRNTQRPDGCKVTKGVLLDPYTGKTIEFIRGESTSDDVQIDHVVALSNAWQTGAQSLRYDERVEIANDPLNLLAVDGPTNEKKSDGDAATWLPPNKPFRCEYVRRQIAVKVKYQLWVTMAERDAMNRVLADCT